MLDHLLETAREITGARYTALGILDRDRRGELALTWGSAGTTVRAVVPLTEPGDAAVGNAARQAGG